MPDYYIDFENYLGADPWGVVLSFYDGSGNIEYMCRHVNQDAATSDDKWEIHKYTLGVYGITVRERLVGVCDDRATLGWR